MDGVSSLQGQVKVILNWHHEDHTEPFGAIKLIGQTVGFAVNGVVPGSITCKELLPNLLNIPPNWAAWQGVMEMDSAQGIIIWCLGYL